MGDHMNHWINVLQRENRATEAKVTTLEGRVEAIERLLGPADERVRGLGARLRVLEERLPAPPGGAGAAAAPRRVDGGVRRRRTQRRHY